MSSARATIAIRPERCDRCGKCVVACPRSLVKVGGGYIYVDVAACQSCFSCVSACPRGALERGGIPGRPIAAHAGAKVVVGSRAEAKAYKKALQAAEKSANTIVKRPIGAPAAATAGATAGGTAVGGRATVTSSSNVAKLGARFAASLGWSAAERPAPAVGGSDRPGVQWTPQEVGALLAVMVAAFAFKQVALSSFAFEVMPPAGQVVARSLILAAYYGIQIALVALLARRHGFGLRGAFGLAGPRSIDGRTVANAGLVVALLVGTRAFSVGWAAMMQGLGWAPPSLEGATFSALFGAGVVGLVLTLLAVAVVGPIAEEFFFRGVALRVLAERVGAWPAVFVTALLYAGSHLEPWVFVSTFVLGLALGWLAWMRRSLGSAIVLHGLYNAVAVIAAYYISK